MERNAVLEYDFVAVVAWLDKIVLPTALYCAVCEVGGHRRRG